MPKRNLRKIKEQMQKLQALIRQIERDFYIHFAKEVEKEIQSGNVSENIKQTYERLKQEYGL